MESMQIDGGKEEDVENLNVHREDSTTKSESLTKAESETYKSEEELSSDGNEDISVSREKREKKDLSSSSE